MIFVSPTNNALTSDNTSLFIIPVLKWLLPDASQNTIDFIHMIIRKAGHFLNYAFLTFLLFRGFKGRKTVWSKKWILYSIIIAFCYGAVDEYLQTMIATRTGSLYDWFINVAGVICSAGIIFKMYRLKFVNSTLLHS
jgi:VanZ family protein